MELLIDLVPENFEPIHYLGQRTYNLGSLSLYYCIGQLCQASSQGCNEGNFVSCSVLHTVELSKDQRIGFRLKAEPP